MIERPTSGELRLHGEDVAHADRATLKRLRPQVQMVFQNPYASLNPRKQVVTLLDEPLAINTDLSVTARRDAARAMMARVGLRPEHERRYPHMFSGGQRQRIAASLSSRKSRPAKRTLPETMRPGGDGTRRRIDSAVTLLPQPDSPTIASVSPRRT